LVSKDTEEDEMEDPIETICNSKKSPFEYKQPLSEDDFSPLSNGSIEPKKAKLFVIKFPNII
jgi:hypothetical protein